jgi:glyoxylase-like metal-dependent hydrolase (beta-lactamase superfamily II)
MTQMESKHFTLERLSEGVFAAIHREGGWAIANAGIIDLGDTTVIFDTFLTPDAAIDLQAVAEAVTGRKVDKVINSHYHNDHIWGNLVFRPHSDIISSIETRHLIRTSGRKQFDWYRENSSSRLIELQKEFDAAQDEQERRDIRAWITYYEGLVESMPSLEVCLPNLVFSERLEIHGTARSVELISFGNAHSGTDTILQVPSEKIIFMSDLLSVGYHPYLADGDSENLSSILISIMDFDGEIFVPGHGPVGTLRDLHLMKDYIDACYREVEELVKECADSEAFPTIKIPRRFRDWRLPSFFQANVRALHQRRA